MAPALTAVVSDQYLVAFGKSGGLGCFTVAEPFELNRGDRVVVKTSRGLEFGEVRGPATLRQARLIGALAAGDILRRCTDEDEAARPALRSRSEELFAALSQRAHALGLAMQILDVDLLFDARHAVVQFVGNNDADAEKLAQALQGEDALDIRFENLALQAGPGHDEPAQGGCGKPDCGRVDGGGCSTCGSSGGCTTCGSGSTHDLRAYFTHLRGKMEATHRTPLL
jgi:hypothetical protein